MSKHTKTKVERDVGEELRNRICELSPCKKDGVRRRAQFLLKDRVLHAVRQDTSDRTVRQVVEATVSREDIERAISKAGKDLAKKRRRKAGRRLTRHHNKQILRGHGDRRFTADPRVISRG